MSGNSSMKVAEEVLRIYNGGMMRSNNSQWDLRMVELMVRQERDFVVKDLATSMTEAGKPLDDSMFTRYEGMTVSFSETTKTYYLDLPNGYMSLSDDRGIRVMPGNDLIQSSFRRMPSGAIHTAGDKLYAEGNILWMVRPPMPDGNRRIVFLGATSGTVVTIEVVIGDSANNTEVSVGIPDGLESVVINRVLSKMGFRRQAADRANDTNDQS